MNLSEYKKSYSVDPVEPFAEIFPSYFTNSNARENIRFYFPEAKIVITLRDPVARAVSAIRHVQRIGLLSENLDINAASENKHIRNILDGSDYERHVALWASYFPGRVIQVRQNSEGVYSESSLGALSVFLGLGADVARVQNLKANTAKMARFSRCARVINILKAYLSRIGAHRLIRYLKMLEPLFYKKSNNAPLSPEIISFLQEKLKD